MLAKEWISLTSETEYYIDPEEVKLIQFEPTSYCNFRCVSCSRTDAKTLLPKQIVLDHQQHIPLELIEPIFKDLKNLKRIKFDGDIGDCFSHPKLYDIVTTILKLLPNVKITLHTNLCGGSDDTFLKLIKLPKVELVVGVDGLREKCDTYRRGASWSIIEKRFKMIKEVAPYKHGWRMLDFDYNKDQQDEARQMAVDYKFDRLEIAQPYGGSNDTVNRIISESTSRTKKGTLKDKEKSKEVSKHKNTKIDKTHEKVMSTESSLKNYVSELENTATGKIHSCPWQISKSLQVMSDGTVWPCCWSSDMNKFLEQFGTSVVSQKKFYLQRDYEQQYYLTDWVSKLGKDWEKKIRVSATNTIKEVMSSSVYKKLDYLLRPNKDRYNLTFCTHSCANFNTSDIEKAGSDPEGHILSRAQQTTPKDVPVDKQFWAQKK